MASRAFARGFTLLEILVVMSLLSIVMLALGASLRSVAQAETRIDQRLERSDEMRVAVGFMRATLERVSARKIIPLLQGAPGVLYAAAPDSFAWVGVMPARYGAGGRYFFRIAQELVDGESALVVRFVPWVPRNQFPDWSGADYRVLVKRVRRVAMLYQDAESNPVRWTSDWTVLDRLPDQLQVEIETDTGPWPPLNFAMRAMPAGNPSLGGPAFGGT